MSSPIKILLLIASLLIIASWASCQFGPDYDLSKIPLEERYDLWWGGEPPAGDRWLYLGGVLFLTACSLVVAIIKLIRQEQGDSLPRTEFLSPRHVQRLQEDRFGGDCAEPSNRGKSEPQQGLPN